VNFTYTETVLSGGIVPSDGVIVHWPIFKQFYGYPFPPLPAFFAYFFTYLVYFFAPFLSVAAPKTGIVLAASNFASLSFLIFSNSYFRNYSLALSKIEKLNSKIP
jgi:hypothetical protein